MKKIIIAALAFLVAIVLGYAAFMAVSPVITFFSVLFAFAAIFTLLWEHIKTKKWLVVLLLIFFIVAELISVSAVIKSRNAKPATKTVVQEETTEDTEEETTVEEETTSLQEETTLPEEKETTSPQEKTKDKATKGNTGSQGSSNGNTGSGNQETVGYRKNAETEGGMPETQQPTDGKIGGENTTSTGSSDPAPEESTTSTPPTERQEVATTPAPSEKPGGIVSPTNPYEGTDGWDKETTQQPTNQPPTKEKKPDDKDPVEEQPTTTQPTTPEEETQKTMAVAKVTGSYTKGATVANVLVTFNTATNVTFRVTWYKSAADYRSVKNSDGSYSLKVSVPSNFKGKLIVTVFDEAVREIGEKSFFIENLDY